MEQKFKLGQKVQVVITGEIREAYIGYETNIGDVIKYKVVADRDQGTVIGLCDENIKEVTNVYRINYT